MCGIAAYTGPSDPAAAILATACIAASARGPHGSGWAYFADGAGVLNLSRRTLEDEALQVVASPARALVAHARLASSAVTGNQAGIGGAQPIAGDGFYLVHNGNVPEHRAIAFAYGVDASDLDSEVIARLIEIPRGRALVDRVGWAVQQVPAVCPMALAVLGEDGTLITVRRATLYHDAHPLYALEMPTGVYVSSRPFADAELLPVGIKAWRPE